MEEKVYIEHANFLAALLSKSSTLVKETIVDENIQNNLYSNCLLEINKPFAKLIEEKQMAFCLPDSPISYPLSINEALDYWNNEMATMNIQNIQCTNLYFNKVCFYLEKILLHPVTCSIYISKKDSNSFEFHTDKWEGLAIQLYGEKLFIFKHNNNKINISLFKGDCIRISKNDLHKVETLSFSIHLNFACHKYL